MVQDGVLGKIKIKNIYQKWQGESMEDLKNKEDNHYTLRIGLPKTDNQLRNDPIFFILDYLSYNPLNKQIEKRDLVAYRNMERVFIGQSVDETKYPNSKLYVDGNIIADNIILKKFENLDLGRLIPTLINKIENLQLEVQDLKRQLKNQTIYK